MRCSRPCSGRARFVPTLAGLGFFVLAGWLVSGCGTEPPAAWPWWTTEDTLAVEAEVGRWRPVLDAGLAMAGSRQAGWMPGLTDEDSVSATGDTLYKFARLTAVWIDQGESNHRNEYLFGVTADSIEMSDTFCQVTYRDSLDSCKVYFEYDSLWVVGFRPDTSIEPGPPPETTITNVVSYVEKRGMGSPQQAEKRFLWTAMRSLFLRRDTLLDTLRYDIAKTSGFGIRLPDAEEAPNISSLVFSRPGREDTFFFSPRRDGRGLYNLKPLDSLYTIDVSEEVRVTVATSTPADTTIDKNRFFVGVGGQKSEITVNARRGDGVVAFPDTGLQHLHVEVLPVSNLFYPGTGYAGTIWAMPVRVKPRQ